MLLWRHNYTILAKIRFKNSLQENPYICEAKNGKVFLFVLYESYDMELLMPIDVRGCFLFPDREILIK